VSVLDPLKRKKVVELAKTGNYSQAQIQKLIEKEFGSQLNFQVLKRILKEEKINLPKASGLDSKLGTKQAELAAEKTVYLKDYSFADLEKDINAGKTRGQIVDDLLVNNKDFYETLKLPSGYAGKKSGALRYYISGALGGRMAKRPDLLEIEKIKLKTVSKDKKNALKDIRNFIEKNKEAYKKVYASNKIGAVDGFKEKVLDYASKKYPEFINRAKGKKDVITGQRLIDAYSVLGREVTGAGDYGRDKELNKDIRKSLGIPERPLKGEGESIDRLNRAYNKNITNLLKEAQKQGKIPLIDPKTGNKINSEAAYSRYIDRKDIDPVRNLFGKYFQFGTEHMGGIARANLINDVDALNQIAALDTFTNKFDKGTKVDQKVSTLLKLAKQSSGDKSKDYLETANKLLRESDAKYGLDSTKYKLIKNEIVPIQPNEENIFKRAVTAFAATERYKDPNFKLLDPDLKKSIMAFKKGNEETGSKFLKTAVQTLINSTDKLTKPEQLRFCKFLSNGGLPGDCKQAIKQDPEKAAKILSEAPVTSAAMNSVKKDSQKLIRLFRGESFPNRTNPEFKFLNKLTKEPIDKIKKNALAGQWFTSKPDMAAKYSNTLGRTKYVDVTPAEYLKMKTYPERINKTNSLIGRNPDKPVKRYPIIEADLPNPDSITVAPRYKLNQLEKSGRMKSKLNLLGEIENPAGTLIFDSTVGGFIDPADPTKLVSQEQIKTWAQDNPMPVRVGEEPLKVATNKSVLKNVGRTLATIGAPLPTALIDGYFINQQVKEGKGTAEIASNPLNWLGLATMSTLSDVSGVSKAGKLNSVLRLGLNPGVIRGISRFAGLPGLAVSTALTAYDQYKKYQNEEGFIYNLFNKEEK